jgi:hypothetical protein
LAAKAFATIVPGSISMTPSTGIRQRVQVSPTLPASSDGKTAAILARLFFCASRIVSRPVNRGHAQRPSIDDNVLAPPQQADGQHEFEDRPTKRHHLLWLDVALAPQQADVRREARTEVAAEANLLQRHAKGVVKGDETGQSFACPQNQCVAPAFDSIESHFERRHCSGCNSTPRLHQQRLDAIIVITKPMDCEMDEMRR